MNVYTPIPAGWPARSPLPTQRRPRAGLGASTESPNAPPPGVRMITTTTRTAMIVNESGSGVPGGFDDLGREEALQLPEPDQILVPQHRDEVTG